MKFREGLVIKFKTLEDFREFEKVYEENCEENWKKESKLNYRINPKYIKIIKDGFCSWIEEEGFVKWRKIRKLFLEEKREADHGK